MSFSGLKTALRRHQEDCLTDNTLRAQDVKDLCAGFQLAVAQILAEKARRALKKAGPVTAFAVAGGVAANTTIRNALSDAAEAARVAMMAPPLSLCTDNAAMIAWVGVERFLAGDLDDLTVPARPRWPLDQVAQPMLGSGKRGAKA